MIGRLLCLVGWHKLERSAWAEHRLGDGHPSRWRPAGVCDVTYRCDRSGCRHEVTIREGSKSAIRRLERSQRFWK